MKFNFSIPVKVTRQDGSSFQVGKDDVTECEIDIEIPLDAKSAEEGAQKLRNALMMASKFIS